MVHYENWISYRYLTSKKGKFLSFLNFISIAGVAIGVMALIVVTGVMTGFGNNLREKIIGTTPHIVIEKENGLNDFLTIENELRQIEGIISASPFIQGNIFIEDNGQASGIAIRGIDPNTEGKVTRIEKYLSTGSLDSLSREGIIIGRELARYYGYKIGDTVTLISPGSGLQGQGWRYQLKVSGIFYTGMIDYDTNLVIVGLNKAQEIFNYSQDTVTGVGVRIQNPEEAKAVKERIYKELGYSYFVKTWIDINRSLFEALFLEKWGLFIILTLMVIIASFNIISTLVVTVTSKTHDIGILKSFGVPSAAIRRIFTKQGIFIGTVGIFWGLVLGIGISFILSHYVEVPSEIYSIDRVPVDLQLFDILMIVMSAALISYLASIYPAAKAAQMQPVDALRYE